MDLNMTTVADCRQISFDILSTLATKQPMMNFQVPPTSADLASLAVAFEDLKSQLLGHIRINSAAQMIEDRKHGSKTSLLGTCSSESQIRSL